MQTKSQQAQMDDLFARAGKISAALQQQIDQLRAAKTDGEVMSILFRDAHVARPKIETELLCMVAVAQQVKFKEEQDAANQAALGRIENVKTKSPTVTLRKNREPQTKQNDFFNGIKVIGIIVLIFFGAVALLSAIFDKKHTGQAIEYTIIYTTINGQYYEKEETAEDLNSEYVTFSDGTRVSWTAVKTKKAKIYPDELGANTNSNR